MPLKFAEEALRVIKRTFALTGKDAPITELEDGLARQSLDINRLAMAGFAFGPGDGLFSSIIRHSHAAGGNITETIDPYSSGTVIAPLPLVISQPLTWWYLGSMLDFVTTQTSVDEVQVMRLADTVEGWSDGTIAAQPSVLARWDTMIPTAGSGGFGELAATGAMFQAPQFPIRWSRNDAFRTSSRTTGAGASTLDISSWWYLARVGLYPDAV